MNGLYLGKILTKNSNNSVKDSNSKLLDFNVDDHNDDLDSMLSDDDDLKHIPDDELEVCIISLGKNTG